MGRLCLRALCSPGSRRSVLIGALPVSNPVSSAVSLFAFAAFSAGPLNHLARLFLRFFEIEHQLVGRVVLEDVTHVGGGFDADFLRRDDLDVVKPLVRSEVALGRFLAQVCDAPRTGVVGRKKETR